MLRLQSYNLKCRSMNININNSCRLVDVSERWFVDFAQGIGVLLDGLFGTGTGSTVSV